MTFDYFFIINTIIIPIFLSSFLILLFSKIAFRINLIDRPDSRKIHKQPIPVVGGIGIYITLIILK